MRVCGDIQWIPSIDLEPSDPKCSTKYHYTSLSAINQTNSHDSRSRLSVSNNTVREEPKRSYSIIGIMNELAASYLMELNENKLVSSFWHCSDNKKNFVDDKAKQYEINNCEETKTTKTTSLSSLCCETDIELMENDKINYSSNLCIPIVSKETSISYTIDDNDNTPIPPLSSHTNNSKLYQFLFNTIDTESDDDDIFPTSLIDINYNENTTNPTQKTTFIQCKHLWEL